MDYKKISNNKGKTFEVGNLTIALAFFIIAVVLLLFRNAGNESVTTPTTTINLEEIKVYEPPDEGQKETITDTTRLWAYSEGPTGNMRSHWIVVTD